MRTLAVLVDFDNLDPNLTSAGPVSVAKLLVPLIPVAVLDRHDAIQARMYGGWRSQGTLTTGAQRLIPDIRAASPCVVGRPGANTGPPLRVIVELAEGPMGTAILLEETLVRDRGLRKFRARSTWPECLNPGRSCGMSLHSSLSHSTRCTVLGCGSRLSNVLVRDEQKMVDTLLVADLAYQALAVKATDVVVVTSDTDMWPGILLAATAGCKIVHIHTRPGWRTQRHLVSTLNPANAAQYTQTSV